MEISCLHENLHDLEDRTDMKKEDTRRMSVAISECLSDFENEVKKSEFRI